MLRHQSHIHSFIRSWSSRQSAAESTQRSEQEARRIGQHSDSICFSRLRIWNNMWCSHDIGDYTCLRALNCLSYLHFFSQVRITQFHAQAARFAAQLEVIPDIPQIPEVSRELYLLTESADLTACRYLRRKSKLRELSPSRFRVAWMRLRRWSPNTFNFDSVKCCCVFFPFFE